MSEAYVPNDSHHHSKLNKGSGTFCRDRSVLYGVGFFPEIDSDLPNLIDLLFTKRCEYCLIQVGIQRLRILGSREGYPGDADRFGVLDVSLV